MHSSCSVLTGWSLGGSQQSNSSANGPLLAYSFDIEAKTWTKNGFLNQASNLIDDIGGGEWSSSGQDKLAAEYTLESDLWMHPPRWSGLVSMQHRSWGCPKSFFSLPRRPPTRAWFSHFYFCRLGVQCLYLKCETKIRSTVRPGPCWPITSQHWMTVDANLLGIYPGNQKTKTEFVDNFGNYPAGSKFPWNFLVWYSLDTAVWMSLESTLL